jgi:hypothetical protein
MSYPGASTPVPSIHQIPGSRRNKLAFEAQELEAIGQKFLAGFLQEVARCLVGLVPGGQNLAVLRSLLTAWAHGIGGDIGAAEAFIETLLADTEQAGAADLAALINAFEAFLTGWRTALAEAGVSLPTQFVQLLRGLIPAAVPQFNGTAIPTGVTGFVDNLNGTISYTIGEAEADVAHLIQQADGTVVTAAQLVHQASSAASAAGASIGQAVATGQQMADHGIAAIEGGAVEVAQSAQAYAASMTNMFTNWVNAWSGQSLPSAASPEITAAAEQAAQQAAVQAQQTAAINAQLPHFYGGHGTSGLNASANFTGLASLPSTFTQVSTIAKASAQYNVSAASSDSQTVSGIWSSADAYAKYLFLRANSNFTTYDYAKIQSNDPGTGAANCEVGTVVAGVRTVLGTFTLPGAGSLVANSAYTFEATDYTFAVTGPNGLNYSVVDVSHVSQVGPLYRWGGFGTDGWVRDAKVFTQPDGAHIGHYSVPAWVTNGTRFDVFVATQGQAYAEASLTVGTDFTLASLGTTVTVDPIGAEFPTPVHSSLLVSPGVTEMVFNNVEYNFGSNYGYQGVTALDLTVPGSMLNWEFYDSGPGAGPASAWVTTPENTSSTSYTNLPTVTDQVTVNIGPSLMAIVILAIEIDFATTDGTFMLSSFAMSGANTSSPSDRYSCSMTNREVAAHSRIVLLTSNELTNVGATTFKMQHRVTGGTLGWKSRNISVIPL